MAARTTVQLDPELLQRMRPFAGPRGLNRFIVEAVAEKVSLLERAQIEQEMKEGYIATRQERKELNEDWGILDGEGWPD